MEVVLIVLTIILFIVYYVLKTKNNYWKKRKIPYAKPVPILGNYGEYLIMRTSMPEVAQSLCKKFPNAPYFGVFYGTEPTLMVQDPEVIKQVITKDYYYCSSREISDYTHKEVFTQNLFFTYGDRWKVLRQNLTPLFSSSKMKNMFYLIEKCSHSMQDMLDNEFGKSPVVKIRDLFARFTMDGIGTCAFGINTRTMEKDSYDNPFAFIGASMFLDTYYRGFKIFARAIWPMIFYGIGMKTFPTEANRFFHKVMTEVFAERQYKPSARNDFVDLVLALNEKQYITGDRLTNMKGDDKKVTLKVDDEFLVAQCLMFFAAGFETSSTVLRYTLYELAKHPAAQERAIKEIDEYLRRHQNKLKYECVTELPYLEACINEAMRLYPVLGVLTREVVDKYTLPCGAVLDKGVRIHIPVYHLHHHPEHFPEPEEYRPERFYGNEKQDIKPYTYLPFGEGPRICIGMRFAKMQMMAGVITLLKKYRVELAEGTPRKLQFGARTIVTQPAEEIKLRLVKREGWEQRTLA
ncbi:cytochrome P450 6B2-like [Galleria mellonella]|uniref:unspecific monooxygenase n=1 Tax=Galleria mellonella TaxID=7137 RepID=A0A6J1WS13_GALME|nr:cytochrome P450 6B2-like [Galleria mellonella]